MKKQELIELALEKMQLHGLTSKGWTFLASSFTSFHGDCHDHKKRIRASYILAETEPYEVVLDTILHEIAHALVGCHHCHDSEWKEMARLIGCKDSSAASDFSKETDAVMLARSKYVMAYRGKVVKSYSRKPNRNTIARISEYYVPGRHVETIGKLTIEAYNASVHKEYI